MDASDGKQEKPRFEPPPWERDAFDALARKREAEEAKERWVAQALAAREAAAEGAWFAGLLAAPAPIGQTPPPEAPEPQPAPVPSFRAEPGQATVAAALAPEPTTDPPRAADLDDRQVAAMLIGLRSEEPQIQKAVRPAAGVAAVLTGLAGIGIAAIGVSGIASGGNAIRMSGALMTAALGAMFVAAATWVWIRATRGKGS